MLKIIIAILFLFMPVNSLFAAVMYDENMDGYADKAAAIAGVWGGAADGYVYLDSGSVCYGGSGKCWRIQWDSGRAIGAPSLYLNLPETHVRFYFKQTGNQNIGSKVLKLHGVRTGDTNYSNVTFAQVYSTGEWKEVSGGDGSTVTNDSGCIFRYIGTAPSAACLDSGSVVVSTPSYNNKTIVDGNWHCIEIYTKMNTDGNFDGEYKVWLDGVLLYNVVGIQNRNIANIRAYDHLTLGDYTSQTGVTQYYDNITVSDSYIGPVGGSPPPPSGGAGINVQTASGWQIAPLKVYLAGMWRTPAVKVYLSNTWKLLQSSSTPPATVDYYVASTGCSDSYPGTTESQPWCSLSKVNSSVASGKTVAFKAGGVWNDYLVPVSGVSSDYTVYQTYGTGAKPKVKGVVVSNKSYITIDGLEVWNDNTQINNSPIAGTEGVPFYIGASNRIIVKNCYIWASSANGYWGSLYLFNSSYNTLQYNTVEHLNTGGLHDAFALDMGCSYNIISYNTVRSATHYALSITGANGTSPYNTYQSNYNYIGYNNVTNPIGCAFQIYTNSNYSVVEHNVFKMTGNTLDQYPTVFKLLGTRNIVRNNIIGGSPTGMTNGRGLRTETYVYGGAWPVNVATYLRVYNNVITGMGGTEGAGGAIYIGMQDLAASSAVNAYNKYKNNIIYANTLPYEVTRQNSSYIHDIAFNNNIIYRSGVTNVVWNGSGRSVATQQSNDPLWTGNIQSDPSLDATYHLNVGSPAINAGAQLTTVTSATNAIGSTSFVVGDSNYFSNGMGIMAGDVIQIGSSTRTITNIDYVAHTITVSQSVTWTQGMGVSLPYNGSLPDIGAYEY